MKCTYLSCNCGVGLIWDTHDAVKPSNSISWTEGRTGLFIAGFLDKPEYYKTFHKLCEMYKLVYQSPLRDGQDTGPNSYFLCVFDRSQ